MITREVKALLVCAVVALSLGVSKGQEAHAKAWDTGTNGWSATLPAQVTPEKKAKPRPKQLTGAELYSIHCNRCHPERYPTERTAAQWKTILMHMRVRANLPAEQSRTILRYLQENSGR